MKKFILCGSAAIIIAVVAAVNVNLDSPSNNLSDILLINIEALSQENNGNSGNVVDCYSSSDSKKGATYYDCGPCTKQFNSTGTGSLRTCITR
jgi:hypothetical protein